MYVNNIESTSMSNIDIEMNEKLSLVWELTLISTFLCGFAVYKIILLWGIL